MAHLWHIRRPESGDPLSRFEQTAKQGQASENSPDANTTQEWERFKAESRPKERKAAPEVNPYAELYGNKATGRAVEKVKEARKETPVESAVEQSQERAETAKKSWFGSLMKSARGISSAAGSFMKEIMTASKESSVGQAIIEDLKTARHLVVGTKSEYVRVDEHEDKVTENDFLFDNHSAEWVDASRQSLVGDLASRSSTVVESAKYVFTGFVKEISQGIRDAVSGKKRKAIEAVLREYGDAPEPQVPETIGPELGWTLAPVSKEFYNIQERLTSPEQAKQAALAEIGAERVLRAKQELAEKARLAAEAEEARLRKIEIAQLEHLKNLTEYAIKHAKKAEAKARAQADILKIRREIAHLYYAQNGRQELVNEYDDEDAQDTEIMESRKAA